MDKRREKLIAAGKAQVRNAIFHTRAYFLAGSYPSLRNTQLDQFKSSRLKTKDRGASVSPTEAPTNESWSNTVHSGDRPGAASPQSGDRTTVDAVDPPPEWFSPSGTTSITEQVCKRTLSSLGLDNSAVPCSPRPDRRLAVMTLITPAASSRMRLAWYQTVFLY